MKRTMTAAFPAHNGRGVAVDPLMQEAWARRRRRRNRLFLLVAVLLVASVASYRAFGRGPGGSDSPALSTYGPAKSGSSDQTPYGLGASRTVVALTPAMKASLRAMEQWLPHVAEASSRSYAQIAATTSTS
jgi:hypothetical protein